MVSSGLMKFDDKPEKYWSWKVSFLSATKDLDLSAREELDLMTSSLELNRQSRRREFVLYMCLNLLRGSTWFGNALKNVMDRGH